MLNRDIKDIDSQATLDARFVNAVINMKCKSIGLHLTPSKPNNSTEIIYLDTE